VKTLKEKILEAKWKRANPTPKPVKKTKRRL